MSATGLSAPEIRTRAAIATVACAKHDRRNQRGLRGVLIWRQRDRRDDGAETPTPRDDRHRVQPQLGAGRIHGPPAICRQLLGSTLESWTRPRLLQDPLPHEHPRLRVRGACIRHLGGNEPASDDVERGELGGASRDQRAVGLVVEALAEHDVEGADHHDERERDGADHGQQKPAVQGKSRTHHWSL
jgi:hypothetical protein